MEASVIVEKSEGVATIIFNEPETRNAMSGPLKEGLMAALTDCEEDADVKVVILKGNGKGFCAGGNIKTMGAGIPAVKMKQRMNGAAKLIQQIHSMPKPVISAVHGYAFGAGFSIALASDMIIAAEGTKFGLAFKNLGAIPDCGAHYFLSKVLGPWKAKELIWRGAVITAEEGERYGFINHVVAPEEVFENAKVLASELASGPVQALSYTKSIIDGGFNKSLEDILELEGFGQAILFQTQDHQEGVQAFKEKRTPQFVGE